MVDIPIITSLIEEVHMSMSDTDAKPHRPSSKAGCRGFGLAYSATITNPSRNYKREDGKNARSINMD